MHRLSVVLAILGTLFLFVLAAPLSSDRLLDTRQSSGRGTWFYDSTNESACEYWDTDNELIVAISADIFGSGGSCGKWVWITANGITASAKVADRCSGCGPGDLDMSIALFEKFSELATGVVSITWGWS